VTHWTGSASFRDLDFADDAAVLFLASEIIRIRLDSVMRPRSSSRGGRNTSDSVTVTVMENEARSYGDTRGN